MAESLEEEVDKIMKRGPARTDTGLEIAMKGESTSPTLDERLDGIYGGFDGLRDAVLHLARAIDSR
jgi:hypothetical protein